MDNLINLKDLLNHEILDLHSAEKQIIEALPAMIDNAYNAQLKNALQDHLEATQTHKERLEKILERLSNERLSNDSSDINVTNEDKGFFSRLFGGITEPKCKGTEGLIKEGRKIMDENMTPEVRDAAIIAAAQKIEHYEISGYGTALAYAKQLNLEYAATLLEETLDEEYEADDLLTELAVGQLNIDAEHATDDLNDNISGNFQERTPENTEGKSLFGDYIRDSEIPVSNEKGLGSETRNRTANNDIF